MKLLRSIGPAWEEPHAPAGRVEQILLPLLADPRCKPRAIKLGKTKEVLVFNQEAEIEERVRNTAAEAYAISARNTDPEVTIYGGAFIIHETQLSPGLRAKLFPK